MYIGAKLKFYVHSTLMEDFFIAILLGVCLSCLESNALLSFSQSNIHNRHVKYVTVYNQLQCNTTKNNHFILKK